MLGVGVDKKEDQVSAIRKGARFVVLSGFSTTMLTHWRAPMTDGLPFILAQGTILVVASDSPPSRTAFICVPEDREAFVLRHVPKEIREDPKFAGISFVIDKKEIGVVISPA
jgi:hypothetical protein